MVRHAIDRASVQSMIAYASRPARMSAWPGPGEGGEQVDRSRRYRHTVLTASLAGAPSIGVSSMWSTKAPLARATQPTMKMTQGVAYGIARASERAGPQSASLAIRPASDFVRGIVTDFVLIDQHVTDSRVIKALVCDGAYQNRFHDHS